jgi:hypothetical protein
MFDFSLQNKYYKYILFMALGSCSTAASCSRLVDENGPAPSTGGRRRASTWQLQLSHCSLGRQSHVRRCPADDQRRSGLGSFSARNEDLTGCDIQIHSISSLLDTISPTGTQPPQESPDSPTRQEQPGNPATRQTRQHPAAPGAAPGSAGTAPVSTRQHLEVSPHILTA